MSQGILVLGILFLASSALALEIKPNKEAKNILDDLHAGTKFTQTPLKKLPQNFGGEQPKIPNDRPAEYSAVALKLALSDEAVFQSVNKDIIFPLERMFRTMVFKLDEISEKNASYSLGEYGDSQRAGNYQVSIWNKSSKRITSTDANKKLQNEIRKYSSIEYVKFSPFSISTPLPSRDPNSSLPIAFNIETRMDLRFIGSKGERIHDRGIVNISAKQNLKSGKWFIEKFKIESGEKLMAMNTSFKEMKSFQSGELSNHLRKEAIRRGGYALAIGDIDGDQKPDMIVGHLGSLEIFKGKEDGTFKKLENKKLGIESETLVKSAVIADFDNDGLKDLLLVRFAPSEEVGKDIVMYKNHGSKFEKVTSIKNRYPAYYAMPSAVADFSGNGMLDFYIGFPGAKDFTVLNKDVHGFEGKQEFHPQGLFYNVGQFKFDEVTREKLPYNKKSNAYTNGYPETALVFPHSSAGIDFDLDGNMDIVVVDDKANLSPLYKNNGKGSFSQVAEKIGLTNYDFGMGFTAADLDNDGNLEFIYTNVNFLPAERLHNSLQKNFSEYSKQPGTFGIRIFKSRDNKNYSDITAITGIKGCGDGIGGVEVIDYDNDGFPDIYVTNGLWSGTHPEQDLSSLFVRANSTFNYDFQEVLGTGPGIEEANTSFMRILTGFQGDVETKITQKDVFPSMAGFQRNCLFKNNGNGTFTEVGFLEGVDSIADGYIVGTADLNRDGKMDLILRNGDPGVGKNRFPAVQVFMNQSTTKRESVQLQLRGVKSNKDAIGAIVTAKIGKTSLVRHLIANNGAAQSEGILHFGLDDKKQIDKLVVRWPSGLVQEIKNVRAGYHQILEEVIPPKTAEK